jgi:phosphoribosylanthranilate isomerase
MIIKVCGIIEEDNLIQVCKADIDMVGLNFFPKSKRYLKEPINVSIIPSSIKKVGVFVNEDLSKVMDTVEEYHLDFVQLHGHESEEYCFEIGPKTKVIKALAISDVEDFETASNYSTVEYFLFDTKSNTWGGSGRKFNWSILEHYRGEIPFLLAGGIKADDVEGIKEINHPKFVGVDINSRFEIYPGIKNMPEVHKFAFALKNDSY